MHGMHGMQLGFGSAVFDRDTKFAKVLDSPQSQCTSLHIYLPDHLLRSAPFRCDPISKFKKS